MSHTLFTSESVSGGHPDKVADQISDAILDECLRSDPNSKVACETLVTAGLVVLAGEITTDAQFNYEEVVRRTICEIGYDDPTIGFDYRNCAVLASIRRQSEDIAQGVDEKRSQYQQQGAGDQGMMFGYASNETPELMPLPIVLSHQLMALQERWRREGRLPYLRPDAKAQVTVEYDDAQRPLRVHTVVISTQHTADVSYETVARDMRQLIEEVIPANLLDAETAYYINPTGRFVSGGPAADSGVTGRKTMVDTYGGMGRHGGGAFSGKDPTKVDRSAAYAARYVAKNLVAAGLAHRCEVQLAYAIGVPHPVSIKVDTFGTSLANESILCDAIYEIFDLSPRGIVEMLDLKRPIYRKTANGGHFGREEPEFSWERTDRAHLLSQSVKRRTAAPTPYTEHCATSAAGSGSL
jgi:S-adenosylmethionine synthetase